MKNTKNAEDKPAPETIHGPTEAPTREQVAALAHAIWEREGRPKGHDVEHWLLAESQSRCTHDRESCQG